MELGKSLFVLIMAIKAAFEIWRLHVGEPTGRVRVMGELHFAWSCTAYGKGLRPDWVKRPSSLGTGFTKQICCMRTAISCHECRPCFCPLMLVSPVAIGRAGLFMCNAHQDVAIEADFSLLCGGGHSEDRRVDAQEGCPKNIDVAGASGA